MAYKIPKRKLCYKVYVFLDYAKPYDRYIHGNVTSYYQEDGFLYVCVKKEKHRYDMKHVREVHVKTVKPTDIE